jgi:hypothetical protein
MRKFVLISVAAVAKQAPSILQRESLKRLLQGAAAGAVATIFVGFNWGGWSLGSTADKMAKERSEAAAVAVLAPVCRAQPDAAAKIVAASKVDLYEELRSTIETLEMQRNRIARHCNKSLSTHGTATIQF